MARVEFEQKLKSGEIKRVVRKLSKGDNLFSDGFSNELDQYRGYVVADINANTDTLSFTNGVELKAAGGHLRGRCEFDVLHDGSGE